MKKTKLSYTYIGKLTLVCNHYYILFVLMMFVGYANRFSCATNDDDHHYAHVEVIAAFVLVFGILSNDNSLSLIVVTLFF